MIIDKLTTGNTALIVVDVQNAYCSKKGSMAKQGFDLSPITGILPHLKSFIKATERLGLRIIYTVQVEGEEMPSNLSALFIENHMIKTCKRGSFDTGFAIVKPRREDLIIEKHTWDAFSNPLLDKELKRRKIRNLIIIGVTSDVCVNDTITSAFSRGYNIVVPADLVATFNIPWKQELQKILLTRSWKPYRAVITGSDTLLAKLRSAI